MERRTKKTRKGKKRRKTRRQDLKSTMHTQKAISRGGAKQRSPRLSMKMHLLLLFASPNYRGWSKFPFHKNGSKCPVLTLYCLTVYFGGQLIFFETVVTSPKCSSHSDCTCRLLGQNLRLRCLLTHHRTGFAKSLQVPCLYFSVHCGSYLPDSWVAFYCSHKHE